jgi:hypothetical protein
MSITNNQKWNKQWFDLNYISKISNGPIFEDTNHTYNKITQTLVTNGFLEISGKSNPIIETTITVPGWFTIVILINYKTVFFLFL